MRLRTRTHIAAFLLACFAVILGESALHQLLLHTHATEAIPAHSCSHHSHHIPAEAGAPPSDITCFKNPGQAFPGCMRCDAFVLHGVAALPTSTSSPAISAYRPEHTLNVQICLQAAVCHRFLRGPPEQCCTA